MSTRQRKTRGTRTAAEVAAMKGITVDEMITRFIEQARLVPGFKGSVDEILLAHDLRTGTRRFDVFDGGLLGLAIPTNWV